MSRIAYIGRADERAVPIFPADDLGVARAFYVDRLGFSVEWEDTADGRTGIMGIRRGGIELVIDSPITGHGRDVCASVRVSDADAYYAKWRDRVEIPRPPRNELWGGRTFGVTDPSGNLLFMIGPTRKGGADGGTSRNLVSISPFFIVRNLRASISYYVERLGFQLDFEGPVDDPYYGRVSREGIGIMLKAILPDVSPLPNHTRHEWARWDAYVYCSDPDALFDELRGRGATFLKELSFIDEGLWGFEVADADGYVLAFFRLGDE